MFHTIIATMLARAPIKNTKKLKMGPPSLSNGFPNMTDRQKLAWPLFLDKFLPKILKIKEPLLQWAQTIGWFSDFMKDFKHPKAAAKDLGIKPPGKTILPTNISPAAKKLWGEFWDKYKDKVVNIPDIKTQWAAAVAIFRNYCLKRDVVPFNEVSSSPKVKLKEVKDTSVYMNKRFDLARDKIKKKVQSLFKKFTVSVGRKILKEKLGSITYNPKISQFEIESIIPMKLQAGTRPVDLKTYLEGIGFIKTRNGWNQDLGSHSITVKKSGSDLDLFLTIRFTKAHIISLLQLPETTDDSTIIKKLGKRVKKSMTENTIMLSSIDFENEPIEKEDQDTINKSLDNLSPNDAKMTYGLDYIRSLGDPIFQYHLVNALLEKYGDYPIWNEIKDNPVKMLDRQLETNLEDVETDNPEYGM